MADLFDNYERLYDENPKNISVGHESTEGQVASTIGTVNIPVQEDVLEEVNQVEITPTIDGKGYTRAKNPSNFNSHIKELTEIKNLNRKEEFKMKKKKYKIIKNLLGVKILELNLFDETEGKMLKAMAPIEMTDDELADKITELKMQGLDVEKFHQEYKWNKIRNVKDY